MKHRTETVECYGEELLALVSECKRNGSRIRRVDAKRRHYTVTILHRAIDPQPELPLTHQTHHE